MNKFTGQCVGGPQNGQWMAHWAKSKKFYRPMIAFTGIASMNNRIEAVEIGEYRINDFGQWHWWATESGRAFNKLRNSCR